ncbi:flagellar basal-body rod protein FlgF [candidate division KSB1 bacterium]|nr:MAG: flagellar basal-body rod protein FlgF [candidate division KSB1 bacterium]
MIKGIYTSSMALRQGILRQDITANNLANANTTGFKRDRLFAQELIAADNANITNNPLSIETEHYTVFSQGAFNPTEGPLDFALQCKGFFVVSDGQTESYTRDGHFERSSDGLLVDVQGRAVQGEGGNITLPQGLVTVSADGVVSVEGAVIDRFRVVDFDNPQTLQKAAGSAFTKSDQTDAEVPVEAPVVRQGFLETSNVDAVKEMVEMIATARHYEINAKLLTTQDDTLRHATNEIGRV